jgi:transposase
VLCGEDAPQWDFQFLDVSNGLRYIAKAGNQWRMRPHDLPPWTVVYQQMRRRLGEQAAEDAARMYTWRAVAEFVDAAYSSLLRCKEDCG